MIRFAHLTPVAYCRHVIKKKPKTTSTHDVESLEAEGNVLGTIKNVDSDGAILVQVDGNASPTRALLSRTFVRSAHELGTSSQTDLVGSQVVLSFVGDTPLILDLVETTLSQATRQLTLEAEQLLTLRCGKSSLVLRSDGKITIRGDRMVSKVEGSHILKGGQIKLN